MTAEFDFSAGSLCLDFANTLTQEIDGSENESLNDYADLVQWSVQAKVVTQERVNVLLHESESGAFVAVFHEAIALRGVIYRIFAAVVAGCVPGENDMVALNSYLAETRTWLRLVPHERGFSWEWADAGDRPDQMLWPVVWSAVQLLLSDELSRVKECASDCCSWLFIDASRNHSRRWCDMQSCGNRDKVRRFHERHRDK